ncbi:MAG: DNA polymerase III subunit gamma/tau, partial [Aurantibacter sp.]
SFFRKEIAPSQKFNLEKPVTKAEKQIGPSTPQENVKAPSEEKKVEIAVLSESDPIAEESGTLTQVNVKKINIRLPAKKVSGLSISSLKAKKEHQLLKKEEANDGEELSKDSFSEEEMRKHWANYITKIDTQGQKIMASSLSSDLPKLQKENVIWIELPNNTMKKEVEREQYELIEYLRTKLNNHLIDLKITVNEQAFKKYAFTPEEKYEKLREKNPAIDLLRKEFDLDL